MHLILNKFNDIKYMLLHSLRISKGLFIITLIKSAFTAFLPLINIIGIGIIVESLNNNESMQNITYTIIVYICVNLGIGIISQILILLNNIAERKATNRMQFDYFKDAVLINYHYVQDNSILNLKKRSMTAHPAFNLKDFGKFLFYIVQFFGIFFIFYLLSPWFILILILTSTISILLTFRGKELDYQFKNSISEDERKLDYLYMTMTEYKYAKEIRLNSANSFIKGKYEKALHNYLKKYINLFRNNMKINMLSTVITIVQTVIMYLYFSYQVYLSNISIAQYTVLLSSTTLFTSIIFGFFDNIAQINISCKYTSLLREYYDFLAKNSSISMSDQLPVQDIDFSRSDIHFCNVTFRYPGTDKDVLKNINIKIKKGEKIGIVGLNGSGKTTLIKLLTRIYEPTTGEITIDGINVKDIPITQYLKNISIVLQDFFLFAYSVKENILFDKTCNDDKLNESIEKSGLKEKVNSLTYGINTSIYKELDDNGIELSGGEGQKLALARAIYKDANILILDEPTSTLDPIAEYELFTSLSDTAQNKTTLLISHRLSSTKFCDRIIVIHNGEIIETGTHDDLMKNHDFYSELFNSQARFYKEEKVI